MNNKTVENFNFTIKLREERVYDLYWNGVWVDASGSVDGVLKRVKSIMEYTLSQTEKEKEGWWN